MEIRRLRCGLWILWDERMKTVFQSHDRREVVMFMRRNGGVATYDMDGRDIGRVRYGRLLNF